jgi:hypothetical protein
MMLLEHDLQIPQRFTTDHRRLRQLNLAGCRIEHPFRQLQQTHSLILLSPASQNPYAVLV